MAPLRVSHVPQMLLLLLCLATRQGAAQQSTLVLAEHALMPWALPASTLLPWEGLHNNVEELVDVMAAPTTTDDELMPMRWITTMTMTG